MNSKYGVLYDWNFDELLPAFENPDDPFAFNYGEKLSGLDHYQSDLLPWCPLFGETPFCNLSSGQIKKCIDIIEEARDLWGTYFPNGFPEPIEVLIQDNSWVESEKLAPHFAKEELLLARNLFIEWEDIFRTVYQELRRPYKTDNGASEYSIELHDIDEDDLIDSFGNHKSWLNFQEIKDWQVLSIIAIYEARKPINLTLYSHVPWHYYGTAKWCFVEDFETKPEIITHVQNTKYILEKAKLLKNLQNIQRGQKIMDGAKKSGEARRAQVQDERSPEWEKWQTMALEIWRKNPNISESAAATNIWEKLKSEGKSKLSSKRTIRHRISKPT